MPGEENEPERRLSTHVHANLANLYKHGHNKRGEHCTPREGKGDGGAALSPAPKEKMELRLEEEGHLAKLPQFTGEEGLLKVRSKFILPLHEDAETTSGGYWNGMVVPSGALGVGGEEVVK